VSEWEPRVQKSLEFIDPAPVAALSALLDSGAGQVAVGDALPPLWHWVALPRWSPSSLTDLDGHPRRGDFLPPIQLPRRMFAGGEVTLHGTLVVGDTVVRQMVVNSVEEKLGRSGSFIVVRVKTTLSTMDGRLLLDETQDLVYREATPLTEPRTNPEQAGELVPRGSPLIASGGAWQFVTDPTLLMRFSAATANVHRIHFDWPYATQVEGYPALVVQGPFSTIALAEIVRIELSNCSVARLQHRNFAPLFCGETASLELMSESSGVAVTLRRGNTTTLTTLSVQFNPKGTS
jgi:3-methylfumaryl-CoA hydratase